MDALAGANMVSLKGVGNAYGELFLKSWKCCQIVSRFLRRNTQWRRKRERERERQVMTIGDE